jgi:soluble lytic murein transglycosylase-like protein
LRLCAVASVLAVLAVPPGARAQTGHVETAGLPPATESVGRIDVPKPLTAEDARRYTRIFALQEHGRWREADAEIRKVDDPVLMGHVRAQRYLHPTSYRSRFKELADWLKSYADHPDARQIYNLALRRKPARAAAPHPPRQPRIDAIGAPDAGDDGDGGGNGIGRAASADLGSGRQARRLFFRGDDRRALALAAKAAKRSGRRMPFLHWTAGLAAYRLGEYGTAALHFEAMASSPRLSDWNLAAAAFWAARANLVARHPERVNRWLETAAENPRTFYGLIARRMLGLESGLSWDHPRLSGDQLGNVVRAGSVRRAAALIQAGRMRSAERELRRIAYVDDPELRLALIAIADEIKLPALALSASKALVAAGGEALDRGLYPLPRWQPTGGFTVDRALVYAFMRQESAFNVNATSPVGARGLMQLMPATAGYMAKQRFRGAKRRALYDPALNIELGQRYLRYLIDNDQVGGDIFLLAAAYNGGPGNLAKWQRRMARAATDPLLFIESIPARETRMFVERVLANLWIYRERLGQAAPSLDAIAAGRQPVYKALDPNRVASAENGRN